MGMGVMMCSVGATGRASGWAGGRWGRVSRSRRAQGPGRSGRSGGRVVAVSAGADGGEEPSTSGKLDLSQDAGIKWVGDTKKPKATIDRADLYSDKWAGDEYKGGNVNELTLLIAAFIVPTVLGLVYAVFFYDVGPTPW